MLIRTRLLTTNRIGNVTVLEDNSGRNRYGKITFMRADKTTLSVIVLGHQEGLLAHKTMLSVFRALAPLDAREVGYEIIVHIDRGDEQTIRYFSRYLNDQRFRVFESDFGDIGLSRNRATQLALGEYVAFIDGDDMMSENWLIAALETLQASTERTIVRPEVIISLFPQSGDDWPLCVQFNTDSGSREYEAIRMVSNNPWPPLYVASRALLIEYPFQANSPGFGSEDYTFNADTIADGIRQKVAPETILYYRRREDGSLSQQSRNNTVYRYSKLYDTEFMQSIELTKQALDIIREKPRSTKFYDTIWERAKPIYHLAISIPGFQRLPRWLYRKFLNRYRPGNRFPKWLINDWKAINTLDHSVYPRTESLDNLTIFKTTDTRLGWIYRLLIEGVPAAVDYLFIVPWLIKGGSDKVMLNYVEALRELYPGLSIAIITTMPLENTWLDRLPTDVALVDFGNITAELLESERELLLSRLIVQLNSQNLHIINSARGFRWVEAHHHYIQEQKTQVVASVFAAAITENGQYFSYADPYMIRVYPLLSKIITDNTAFTYALVKDCGFSRDKIEVHYMPVELEIKEPKLIKQHGPYKILWASRVVKSKRPDILRSIAARIDGSIYHIDVYGDIDTLSYSLELFKNDANISYRGPFDGFQSIPVHEYDMYLYTTESDGIPNTLLEAAAQGLPIIASNRGGVSEVVQDGITGYLVDDIEDVSEYLEVIDKIVKHPAETQQLAINAQELLRTRHSMQHFVDQVHEDIQLAWSPEANNLM